MYRYISSTISMEHPTAVPPLGVRDKGDRLLRAKPILPCLEELAAMLVLGCWICSWLMVGSWWLTWWVNGWIVVG